MKLTLVVPCFNEEESVINFYTEVTRAFKDRVEDYELVFVNDGSRVNTPEILRAIYERADNVKVVNFSRNFGKEAAIYAGLRQSSGDYTCVIDADLQQRPEVVLDCRCGCRRNHSDNSYNYSDSFPQRIKFAFPRNHRRISCKNVFAGQGQTCLYSKRNPQL